MLGFFFTLASCIPSFLPSILSVRLCSLQSAFITGYNQDNINSVAYMLGILRHDLLFKLSCGERKKNDHF